jgi:hypothetical protein
MTLIQNRYFNRSVVYLRFTQVVQEVLENSMSLKIEYIGTHSVVVTGEGWVTGQQLYEVNRELYATKAKTAAYKHQLADFRKVTKFDISTALIRRLVEQDRQASMVNPRLKIVIVGESQLIFGWSRMWHTFLTDESIETNVFRSMEPALEWLGISSLPEPPRNA